MKKLISLIALCTLTACSGIPKKPAALTNRVSCTVAKDKAFINSMWTWIGISSEIDEKDVKEICK